MMEERKDGYYWVRFEWGWEPVQYKKGSQYCPLESNSYLEGPQLFQYKHTIQNN